MKLFVIAALVAVAAAGRLEHLERSYLPPDNSIDVARSSNSGFGSPSSRGSFGANSGAFGRAGLQGRNAGGNFAGATSNQYLPPNYGSSANNGGSQFRSSGNYGSPQFAGSLQGIGGQQNFRSQQQSGQQGQQDGYQYSAPRIPFGSPQAGSSIGSPSYQQFGQQSAAASRQYLAPRAGSPSYQQTAAASRQYLAPFAGSRQQPSQQAFDEQTGYLY